MKFMIIRKADAQTEADFVERAPGANKAASLECPPCPPSLK